MAPQIAERLRTFFEPQAEQLKADLRPVEFGFAGTLRRTGATGWLWVASLGDSCLLSAHWMSVERPFVLEEDPDDYACITAVSADTLACCPKRGPRRVADRGNVTAFAQAGGLVCCPLEAGRIYEARNICLLPAFFDRLEARFGARYATLMEHVRDVDPDVLSPTLGGVLAAIGPETARVPGAGLLLESRVDEAVFLLAESQDEADRARQDAGGSAQRRLVRDACALIESDLSQSFTLSELAARLYTSRARLCAVFKEETGASIGAWTRARRLEAACERLRSGDDELGAIARSVGYRRPGSFTEAFERAYGMPPSAWRAMRRP